ncbi:MAG: hypothetical protein ACHQFW_06610 [Chitinophagales bacterium]
MFKRKFIQKKIASILYAGIIFSSAANAQVSVGVGVGFASFQFDYLYEETLELDPYKYVTTNTYSNSRLHTQYAIPLTIHYLNDFGLETGFSFYAVSYELKKITEYYDLATDSLVLVDYYSITQGFTVMSIPLLANYYIGSGKINFILSSGIETNINIFNGVDFSFAAGGAVKYNMKRAAFFVNSKYLIDLTSSFSLMDRYPDPLHKKGIIGSAGILFSLPEKTDK